MTSGWPERIIVRCEAMRLGFIHHTPCSTARGKFVDDCGPIRLGAAGHIARKALDFLRLI